MPEPINTTSKHLFINGQLIPNPDYIEEENGEEEAEKFTAWFENEAQWALDDIERSF